MPDHQQPLRSEGVPQQLSSGSHATSSTDVITTPTTIAAAAGDDDNRDGNGSNQSPHTKVHAQTTDNNSNNNNSSNNNNNNNDDNGDNGNNDEEEQQEEEEVKHKGEEEPPVEICCPITRDVMRLPVLTPYGHVFEYKALATWVRQHHTCPMTRQRLKLADVHIDRDVQARSLQWLESRRDQRKDIRMVSE